jgi:DNA-binding SARP family transcriptional activator
LNKEPVTAFRSDKVRALLAYLAVEAEQPHRREKLAGLLWPEWPERGARSNLRYALANLRQTIGDHQAAPPFLHISRQTVQFNTASDAWVDVTAFTRLLERTRGVSELEEVVALYRGEFLEGFSVADSVPFEEWALLKREQAGRQVLSALHQLAATYERRGEYGRALPHAYRQVELEPWQEKAHRQLMRLLALNRQRGAALTQYEACRRALAEQLDVEPSPRTTRLYEQIRAGTLRAGQIEKRALAVEVVETPPVSLSPPRQRSSDRLPWRWKLGLVGGGLLLLILIIVQAVALLSFGRESSEKQPVEIFVPFPEPIVAPSEGKTVRVCDFWPPQLCVLEARSGKLTQVTDDLEFEAIGGPAWSPGGEQIVFDAGSKPAFEQPCRHNLYTIKADGSDLRQLTHGDTTDIKPAWSPDGQWIAFHRDCALWRIHPDGSGAQKLFGGSELCVEHLTWSPSSQEIAFAGREQTSIPSPYEVWRINHDGSEPRVLYAFERKTDHADVYWDPDGRDIICAHAYDAGETKLLLIPTDGNKPHFVDYLPATWFPDFWPQWNEQE